MAYENLSLRKYLLEYGGGLATQEEANRIDDNQSPDLLNVMPIGRFAYRVRNGISRVGNELTDVGVIRSIYNFAKGTTETLTRSRTTVLEYLKTSNDTWTSLPGIPAFTSDQEFGFANDETYLYGCNAVESFIQWDGNNTGDVTFTVNAGTDLIASVGHGLTAGTIVYVKNSGGTLPAGLSASTPYYVIPSGLTADAFKVSATQGGSAIDITDAGTGTHQYYSSVVQYASNPKGNIFEFYLRRLFVAGIALEPAKVYYSVILKPTDFSNTGSGSFVVGDGGDSITSMKVFTIPSGESAGNKALFVFKKSSRIYQVTFDSTGTLSILEIKTDTGAINDRSTFIMENDIMYIDNGNNIANMGFRENIQNDLRTESTTSILDRTTISYDFTSACSIYFKKRRMALVSAKEYGSDVNNITLAYFYDFKSWWRWRGINANQFAIYLNEVVWASSVDQNVYKYDETKFDDNDGAIISNRATKDIEFQDRNGVYYSDRYKQIRFVIVRGLISPGATMDLKVMFDGIETGLQTVSFSGDDTDIVTDDYSISFGRNVFGSIAFGGSASSDTDFPLREFMVVISLDYYSCLSFRVIPEVQAIGAPYAITSISAWGQLMEDEKFPSEIKI